MRAFADHRGCAQKAGGGVPFREWAMRQGWGGRPVHVEQAQGILIAALGVLAG